MSQEIDFLAVQQVSKRFVSQTGSELGIVSKDDLCGHSIHHCPKPLIIPHPIKI